MTNVLDHYSDLQSSLQIKQLAGDDAKKHALRLIDDGFINGLYYAKSVEDLLRNYRRIEALDKYDVGERPSVVSMLLNALECTEEELIETLNFRLRAVTVMTVGTRMPEGMDQVHIVIGRSWSGETPVPVFERLTSISSQPR